MAAPEHVAAIAQTLHASLSSDAAVRRQAEATLGGAEAQQGFLLILLHLIGNADNTVDAVARQTGAVYFKNVVKKLWAEDAAEEVSCLVSDSCEGIGKGCSVG
jgi:3-methyladenine DNA glycosylase AlkD